MKKRFLLVSLMLPALVHGQALTPKEIIQKIDQTEHVKSSRAKARQTIITSTGKKRTLEMEMVTLNQNEKQLIIYTGPNRVKGDKILMLNNGDDIWFYTPRTDRVRHLASHARRQKVQGSDFSYEDMAGGNIEDDYHYKLLGEEKIDGIPCYKFELIPTETGPHYSKLLYWADKEKYITVRIDYFEDGELIKRLRMYDFAIQNGHWYPKRMVMTNLKEGGETTIETLEVQYDIQIDEDLFSTQNLKRR